MSRILRLSTNDLFFGRRNIYLLVIVGGRKLHWYRHSLLLQCGNKNLTDFQLGYYFSAVKFRVDNECFFGSFQSFLVTWRVSPKRMTIAESAFSLHRSGLRQRVLQSPGVGILVDSSTNMHIIADIKSQRNVSTYPNIE